MRHQIAGKKFNRDTNHRRSMFKTQIKQLIDEGSLTTTLSKAKVLKIKAEKTLIKAKDKSVHNLRQLEAILSSKDHAQKAVALTSRLESETAFVKLTRLARRRGDNTMTAKVELMLKKEEEKAPEKKAKETVKKAVKANANPVKDKTTKESKK